MDLKEGQRMRECENEVPLRNNPKKDEVTVK
jgi:hypothetical protein